MSDHDECKPRAFKKIKSDSFLKVILINDIDEVLIGICIRFEFGFDHDIDYCFLS